MGKFTDSKLKIKKISSNLPYPSKEKVNILTNVLTEGKGVAAMHRRALASCPNPCHPDRYDHANGVTQRSRASICQRAVGENSLLPVCGIISVNRPLRTRMRGGVGAGGEKPPATRSCPYFTQIDRSSFWPVLRRKLACAMAIPTVARIYGVCS